VKPEVILFKTNKIGATWVELKWEIESLGEGIIEEESYIKITKLPDIPMGTLQLSKKIDSIRIGNLKPITKYRFDLFVHTKAGDCSDNKSKNTNDTIPDAILSLPLKSSNKLDVDNNNLFLKIDSLNDNQIGNTLKECVLRMRRIKSDGIDDDELKTIKMDHSYKEIFDTIIDFKWSEVPENVRAKYKSNDNAEIYLQLRNHYWDEVCGGIKNTNSIFVTVPISEN
jgi:hypothetical protein